MNPALTFVLSLPRSGSTVLTTMLSARADVLCLPESIFPALIDGISAEEFRNPERVAALFVVSCTDGSPLALEQVARCVRNDGISTMIEIGRALAGIEGRNPDGIKAMVWKSTRLVGWHARLDEAGARYVILHRPHLNVFESQFRVPFGERNRSPSRFALFARSYEAAFRTYPGERTLDLDYKDIPRRLDEVFAWIGSESDAPAPSGGAVLATSGRMAWHTGIGKEFKDEDQAKLANLTKEQVAEFHRAWKLLGWTGPLAALARRQADRRQAESIRTQASALLTAAH